MYFFVHFPAAIVITLSSPSIINGVSLFRPPAGYRAPVNDSGIKLSRLPVRLSYLLASGAYSEIGFILIFKITIGWKQIENLAKLQSSDRRKCARMLQ